MLNTSSPDIISIFLDEHVYLTVQIQRKFVIQMSQEICDLWRKMFPLQLKLLDELTSLQVEFLRWLPSLKSVTYENISGLRQKL